MQKNEKEIGHNNTYAVVTNIYPISRNCIVWKQILILVFFQLATLIQLISIAQPIMPELTVFDGGIDRLVPQ
mgnify:CR=1 FL=1